MALSLGFLLSPTLLGVLLLSRLVRYLLPPYDSRTSIITLLLFLLPGILYVVFRKSAPRFAAGVLIGVLTLILPV